MDAWAYSVPGGGLGAERQLRHWQPASAGLRVAFYVRGYNMYGHRAVPSAQGGWRRVLADRATGPRPYQRIRYSKPERVTASLIDPTF